MKKNRKLLAALLGFAAGFPALAHADVIGPCLAEDNKTLTFANCGARPVVNLTGPETETFVQMAAALAMTIVIEALVLRYGLKQKGQIINITLINIFTNPLANIVYFHGAAALGQPRRHEYEEPSRFFLLAVIELVVIAVEAQMLRLAGVPKPWQASLTLNLCSLIFGSFLLNMALGN